MRLALNFDKHIRISTELNKILSNYYVYCSESVARDVVSLKTIIEKFKVVKSTLIFLSHSVHRQDGGGWHYLSD